MRDAVARTVEVVTHAAPYVLADPGDLARQRRELTHHRVRIVGFEQARDCGLLLQRELVAAAVGDAVQRDAEVEQEGARRGEARRVGLGQEPACFEAEQAGRAERIAGPRQRLDVAQAAAAVLEIRLEHLGHEPGADAPQRRRFGQLREHPPGPARRELAAARHELVGEVFVPGDVVRVQERGQRVDVLVRRARWIPSPFACRAR